MPITRQGLNRPDRGPLIRSSFEETMEILVRAAAHAEFDDMTGVTDRIIVGLPTTIGTVKGTATLAFRRTASPAAGKG